MLGKKKHKKWGTVYHALSKKPIDLAIVRLYNKATNALVQTRVTDVEGRFLFLVKEPGEYYINVIKQGFTFPTAYLRDEKIDIEYIGLYHGEAIKVSEDNVTITPNIPVDPIEERVLTNKAAIRAYIKERAHLAISGLGVVLSIVSFIVYPTVLMSLFLIAHIVLYLLFRRLAAPKRPKNWGIVYDAETKQPIKHAVMRVFDTRFNKLLETQVTDGQGRYSFLVGKNMYQLAAGRAGYADMRIARVDATKAEEVLNLDI